MNTEVKEKMVKELVWTRDYHAEKLQETEDRLEIIGAEVESISMLKLINKIRGYENTLMSDQNINEIEFRRSVMFELNRIEKIINKNA